MTGRLKKREERPVDVFGRLDRLFDGFTKSLSLRRPADLIRVDEYRQDGDLVIRAELAGIDPDKDVDLTVTGGMLRIAAERREETEEKEGDKGYVRHELRYGSFRRTLPMPAGISEDDIKASYKDGILEIRIPAPPPGAGTGAEAETEAEPEAAPEPKRIEISKS